MARRKAEQQDTQTTPQQVAPTKDQADNPVERWKTEIKLAGKHFDQWQIRGEKVVKRYRDERDAEQQGKRMFNLLWSNVQTLMPALYSRAPKVQVGRRFNDADKVGRVASEILERAMSYELEKYDISDVMKPAVQDRLLPGWGIAWVRYEPHFETVKPPAGEPYQQKTWECTPVDYVYWKDYLVSPARTWPEVRWAARRTFPSRAQLTKRFGDTIGNAIPLSAKPQGFGENDPAGKELQRGEVWEIWDRETKTVFWIASGFDQFCDQRADPLKLETFFPCPKPLLATTTTDTMIPVPDYVEYQDQAKELDDITERIASLTQSLKVVGLYDKSIPELQRLLNEGFENQMVAVDSWAAFAEKGGLKGAIDFLPIERVMEVLTALYNARQQVKNDCYEITGMADIVRGASNPNETATAQQIKGRYANLRLSDLQADVERFAREVIRIKAEIMAENYSPETLVQVSGIMQTPEFAQPPKELLVAPPIPPETPPEMQQQAQMLAQQQQQAKMAEWQQGNQKLIADAIALLKSPQFRDLRIDIETQSMIQMDQEGEKASRSEFLVAVSGFLQQAGVMLQTVPQSAELLAEMLRFVVRGFPVGREMESTIDRFIESMAGAGQKPDPKAAQEKDALAKAKEGVMTKEMDLGKREMSLQATQERLPLEKQLATAQLENTRLTVLDKVKDLVRGHEDKIRLLVDSVKPGEQLSEAEAPEKKPDILPAVLESHGQLIDSIGQLVQALHPQ